MVKGRIVVVRVKGGLVYVGNRPQQFRLTTDGMLIILPRKDWIDKPDVVDVEDLR